MKSKTDTLTSAKQKTKEEISKSASIIHVLFLGQVSSMCHFNSAEVTVFMPHIM